MQNAKCKMQMQNAKCKMQMQNAKYKMQNVNAIALCTMLMHHVLLIHEPFKAI
jgi:hypothetical protein